MSTHANNGIASRIQTDIAFKCWIVEWAITAFLWIWTELILLLLRLLLACICLAGRRPLRSLWSWISIHLESRSESLCICFVVLHRHQRLLIVIHLFAAYEVLLKNIDCESYSDSNPLVFKNLRVIGVGQHGITLVSVFKTGIIYLFEWICNLDVTKKTSDLSSSFSSGVDSWLIDIKIMRLFSTFAPGVFNLVS